jgi:hypothetical protein
MPIGLSSSCASLPVDYRFFFFFFQGIAVCSSTLYIVVGMRVGLHLLANCEHVLVR